MPQCRRLQLAGSRGVSEHGDRADCRYSYAPPALSRSCSACRVPCCPLLEGGGSSSREGSAWEPQPLLGHCGHVLQELLQSVTGGQEKDFLSIHRGSKQKSWYSSAKAKLQISHGTLNGLFSPSLVLVFLWYMFKQVEWGICLLKLYF